MSDPTEQGTTTVRVRASTREVIRRLSAERAQTADTVIRDALAALEWAEVRALAGRQAAAIREDPREVELAREVARDMEELSAG